MFVIFHNLLRNHFDHVHCFSRFLLTLIFTQTVSEALFVRFIEYIFLNLNINFILANLQLPFSSSVKPTTISSTFIVGHFSSCYANSTYHFIICKQINNDINTWFNQFNASKQFAASTKPIVHIRLFHLFKTKTQSIVKLI